MTGNDLFRTALERIASDAAVPLSKLPSFGQPNGWRDVAIERINIARETLALASDTIGNGGGEASPIDMLLFCPKCNVQHIDKPDLDAGFSDSIDGKGRADIWTNPPHRSHLCHACGCIWRPADVPTNGVKAIQTVGKLDNWSPANPPPAAEPVGLREAVRTLEFIRDTVASAKFLQEAAATTLEALATPARTDAPARIFEPYPGAFDGLIGQEGQS